MRAISSVGSEHLVYTERVGGSNPSSPTTIQLYIIIKYIKTMKTCKLRLCRFFIFIPAPSKFSKIHKVFVANLWQFQIEKKIATKTGLSF
jgi:hypothetical protein